MRTKEEAHPALLKEPDPIALRGASDISHHDKILTAPAQPLGGASMVQSQSDNTGCTRKEFRREVSLLSWAPALLEWVGEVWGQLSLFLIPVVSSGH